jgi:hypothetical protein
MQHRQSFKLQLRACMYALGSVAQNVCHNSVGSALTVISPIHALAVPHVCLSVCSAVGLVSSLVQHGVLTRPAQLAGSSAGSLIAASFNAGGGGGVTLMQVRGGCLRLLDSVGASALFKF